MTTSVSLDGVYHAGFVFGKHPSTLLGGGTFKRLMRTFLKGKYGQCATHPGHTLCLWVILLRCSQVKGHLCAEKNRRQCIG